MTLSELINLLAEKDRIAFKKHGLLRMHKRNFKADEVKQTLIEGEVIEDYPDDRPLPSCLILGYNSQHRAMHVVVAVDENDQMLWVITVYEPTLDEWEVGFKTRRNR